MASNGVGKRGLKSQREGGKVLESRVRPRDLGENIGSRIARDHSIRLRRSNNACCNESWIIRALLCEAESGSRSPGGPPGDFGAVASPRRVRRLAETPQSHAPNRSHTNTTLCVCVCVCSPGARSTQGEMQRSGVGRQTRERSEPQSGHKWAAMPQPVQSGSSCVPSGAIHCESLRRERVLAKGFLTSACRPTSSLDAVIPILLGRCVAPSCLKHRMPAELHRAPLQHCLRWKRRSLMNSSAAWGAKPISAIHPRSTQHIAAMKPTELA